MNNKEILLDLLHEKLAGIISKEDDAYIERLLQKDEEARRLWREVQQNAISQDEIDAVRPLMWNQIRRRTINRPQRRKRLRIGLVGVAALGMVVLVVFVFLRQSNVPHPENQIILQIAGGKAIPLPQTGSQRIRVAEAVLDVTNDTLHLTALTGNAAGWNTLSVPNGKTYTLILADSSVVSLNEASRLKFPATFAGNQREVYLEGEGFFEISSSTGSGQKEATPFVVHTDNATVTVLGTVFNVNTYNGSFSTSLVQGKVVVAAGEKPVMLTAGKRAVLDTTGQLVVQELDDNELTWKTGIYLIDNEPFSEIAPLVEKWYHIQVVLQYPASEPSHTYFGVLQKDKPVTTLLNTLKAVNKNFAWRINPGKDTLFILHP